MNHNQLDFESDFMSNLRDFLRRHTGFRSDDYSEFRFQNLFDIPAKIREVMKDLRNSPQIYTLNCFTKGSINEDILESKEKITEI
jgi:hypothetical protein